MARIPILPLPLEVGEHLFQQDPGPQRASEKQFRAEFLRESRRIFVTQSAR